MGAFLQILRWRLGLDKDDTHASATPYVPQYAEPDLKRINRPDPSRIQITWVGHSTFLIQVAGKNILTDPTWGKRASPIRWLGPKRFARPGLAFTDLPHIDIVVISHSHYDHLDRPTIKKLGATPHYILPPNLGKWFTQLGISNTTELEWWSDTTIDGLRITAVPAKHWSKRSVWGKQDVGWGGYVIETPARNIYFAGDTGYHKEYFKEIGKRFPRIDLGLIPIGAYYPEWFFGRYHINPREAIVVHREVGAKKSIGMHWGTFKLTQEPLDEPPTYLASETASAKLPSDEFTTMKIGETRLL